MCDAAGGELEQIQFLLSHLSVQTTERCFGGKKRLKEAVNDGIGIEPHPDEIRMLRAGLKEA